MLNDKITVTPKHEQVPMLLLILWVKKLSLNILLLLEEKLAQENQAGLCTGDEI